MREIELALTAVKTYAELHPRPVHVTQKQAAQMLHLSVGTIRKMIATGGLKLNKFGLIPIGQIDMALAS
jgi:hypothetical protein